MPKYQDLSLFRVPDGFRGRSKLYVLLWWGVQASLFSWSPQPAYGWRRFLLRIFGARIGKGVIIRPSARFTYPWKVQIGDHSWIGDRAELYSLSGITIGSNCCISQDCYLAPTGHDPKELDFRYIEKDIVIEDEVWLASGVFVMPGVRVGIGTVVLPRAVVSKDTPEGRIFAGVPARDIGPR